MKNSSSVKAFGRGLSYHAGAGIGEAIRLATTAASLIAVAEGTRRLNQAIDRHKIKHDVKNYFKNK